MKAVRPRMLARLLATTLPTLVGALMAVGIGTAAAQAPSGPPENSSSPTVKGSPADGKRLKVAGGDWSGAKPIAYAYEWQRCSAAGTECVTIGAAKGDAYKASSEDVGHTLRALVTASNSQGSANAVSLLSPTIAAVGPHRRKSPVLAGAAEDGQILTASNGTWKGSQPLSYTYRWQSCLNGTCSTIAGATESSYRASTSELGEKLRVVVTATNSVGSASAASKVSAKVIAGPPVGLVTPSVSGLVLVGQTVSADVGVWGGTGPFEYSYQWRTCNLAGECSDVAGAEGPTYTVSPLDVANSVEVRVTAANALGSSSVTSAPTNAVSAVLPSNSGLPSISGLLQDGGLLSALTGSWSGTAPLSYSYQWELCNAAGAACQNISEGASSTLALVAGDVGSTLRVVVTATNSGDSTSATSEATGLIGALLPSNSGLPSISGLLQDGGLLSALTGSWSGTAPLSYSYQWELCNAAGAACKTISEAIGSTLGLAAADVGSTLRVVVTATNSGGSTSATSEATSLVKALLPANTSLPSISGLLQTGQLLSALKGSWSGTEPITYAYQWQLCSALGGSCGNASKATEPTFKLALGDVGLTLRVIVTATNAAGSTSATSAVTGLISGLL